MIIDDFEKSMLDRDCSPATMKGYRSDVVQFMAFQEKVTGEKFLLSEVTPTDIRAYRQYLITEKHYKASTVNRRLAALSAYMSWGKQAKLIEVDPSEHIRGVQQVPGGPQYLDKKEQYSLQRAIEKDLQISRLRYPKRWVSRQRDNSLVIFLLHTGLRLNEALALRVNDIDINERKGKVIIRQGKGGKQRIVPMNMDARNAINDWLAARPKVDSEYLWIAVENDQEGSLSGRSVQRVIRRIGQDAGIMRLTPHILRHTFGKNLVDSGVGLEKVAALLGHSSLNTTRIYIVPNQQDLEKAVEKLVIE